MQELIGSLDALKSTDPETYEAILAEEQRQRDKLLLIASENFASPAVLAAQGSVMTNKYAEGYPGKRYYGGCQHVDTVETLAIERAKQIFGAEHVNVQPHSGSQANMAAYLAVLKPGDTILGLDLAQGGHLTHGSKVNFSGIIFRAFSYGVDRQTETIDYDAVERSPKNAVRACWWSEPAPMPARSTSLNFRRLPSRSAPICWSTWRTLPD